MTSEWAYYRLGDLIDVKHGWSFKGEFFRDEPTRYLLLTPGNFAIGGGFQLAKQKYYNGSFPEEFTLNPGELIITMTDLSKESDTLGYPAIVPELPNLVCLHNQRIGRVVPLDSQKIDLRYLYYVCCSKEYREEILASASGTAVKHTAPERIKRFGAYFPGPNEQRSIARILGALDDKIELNRRMNHTLESMAQALFKSWFVDFDPVVAKSEGRQPYGMNAETATLFASEFQDSELGAIPKGWRIGKVSDLGNVVTGKTPPTKEQSNFGIDVPFITIPDMHGKVFVVTTERYLSEKGANFQKNKLLPPLSVCVSCIATPGLVALTSVESQTNQQINSVVPRNGFSPFFCFGMLREIGDEIGQQGSGGTVYSNLNKGNFSDLQIALPPLVLTDKFHVFVKPLFDRLLNNEKENLSLSAIRDSLLPKLLTGEIRVKVT